MRITPPTPITEDFFLMLCCMLYQPESLQRPQVILQTFPINFSVTSELIQYLSQTENLGDSPIYPQCYPVSKTIQTISWNPRCAFFFFKFFNNKAPKRKQNYKMCHKRDKDDNILNLGHI